ncbi:DUF354 domain-containing protein [Cyclobacterium plantarum]|uniref:DUF354 domain-containing protein n=1 Tax=Cyclobacterium plantarum TaxID=2716263 RepID=A0ABX0H893_9BACT|nr:DUF354 domain-containing protein [Cyclobacterium plantarum]NHE57113.1 DUF354 domain-containing protein [Cyclobacterium plantarum]
MKIWIDFINTPQVSFWVPFIRAFQMDNHELLLTCRDSGNTLELLKLNGLEYQLIGKKVGKGFFQKLLFFPKRIYLLYSFIIKHKPDVAASQSSFYQPIVARILGIPCLYTNDNEHARGNLFGFYFASKVILPLPLSNEGFVKKWPLKSKVSFYPSVKEAIYLSQDPDLIQLIPGKKTTIYFRPEPWSAQYYSGPLNFFDQTILKIATKHKVIILPRDPNQRAHYKQEKFNQVSVAVKPLKLKDILSNCLLFIGAGGSMTRELAVLGIPAISIYQAETLCVDRYLVDKGRMKINPTISYAEINKELDDRKDSEINTAILDEGKKSFHKIKDLIFDLK